MAKRSVRKSRTHYYGLGLMIGGALLVTISTTHNILRLRSLRLDQKTVNAYLASPKAHVDETVYYPTHIFIKWRVDVDIEPAVYANKNWTISPDKASFLVSGGKMGRGGNIIIYGHNTRNILGNIRVLKKGELITLTTQDGDTKNYQVDSTHEVTPQDNQLIQPTTEEVLTLYTCSGFLDSKRFIVRALPVTP